MAAGKIIALCKGLLEQLGLTSGGTNATAIGPSSATDNALARFDGTTGKLIQNSTITAADTGAVAWGTGGGAIVHMTGPSDQNFIIDAGTGRDLNLRANSANTFIDIIPGNTKMRFDSTSDRVIVRTTTPLLWGSATVTSPDRGFATGSVTLTDNSATTVLTLALASGARIGGVVDYSIDVTDGTDHQVLTGQLTFSAVDKAGVLTSAINESGTQSSALSAGTLTDTWTILDGTNAISLQVNANSSLTPTAMKCRFVAKVFGATITPS